MNKPLLPPICDPTKANLQGRQDFNKTWDFFPEKKIEFLVKGYSYLPMTYKGLRLISKVDQFFPIGMKHEVVLKKEPANKFDPNAISVWLKQKDGDDKLGYIPKWLTDCFHSEWDRIGKGYIYQVLDLSDSLIACRVVMGYDDYKIENLEGINISERFDNLLD